MKQLERQAIDNATNYLKDKYNFNAEVISTKIEKKVDFLIPDLFPEPTGKVFVEFLFDNKKFEVYISGEGETIDGKDNYQYKEIIDAVLDLIETKINIESDMNLINFGELDQYKEQKGLIKELYVGNNLQEIIDNNNFRILLECINTKNLQYIQVNNLLSDFANSELTLINYHSLNSYKKSSIRESINGFVSEELLEENAMFIESAYTIYEGNSKYHALDVKSFDGIYFYNDISDYDGIYCYNNCNDDNSSNQNVSLSYSELATDIKNWAGENIKDIKRLSNDYLVNGDYRRLYIYIPSKKLKDIILIILEL